MTTTQLKLAIELNERIQKLKQERLKYKNAFDKICLFLKDSSEASIEIKNTTYKIEEPELSILQEFPAEECA